MCSEPEGKPGALALQEVLSLMPTYCQRAACHLAVAHDWICCVLSSRTIREHQWQHILHEKLQAGLCAECAFAPVVGSTKGWFVQTCTTVLLWGSPPEVVAALLRQLSLNWVQ